jgi:hypothetical protein
MHKLLSHGRPERDANCWLLDETDVRILASIQVTESSPIIYVPIAVRPLAQRSRARGEFGIWRFNGEMWMVEHGRVDERFGGRLPALTLLLAGAPERVSETMARLIV